MAEKKVKREIKISDLISSVKVPENPDIYVNHAQFAVSGNEVFVDLYFISPNPGDPHAVTAAFKQRIILPHTIVKGFATAMANSVARFELETNIVLPNQREQQPDDKITIWSQDEPGTTL